MKNILKAWLSIFRSRGVIVFLGFAIGGLCLYMTARQIHWNRVEQAFNTMELFPWLPLAVITYIIGMLLRGLRLQLLVKEEANLAVGTASNIVAVGYATNNILPARLGEFARAGMLAERTGLPYILAVTVTFLERLLDGLTILFLFVAGSMLMPVSPQMHQTAGLAAILFAVAMSGVAFIALAPQTAISLASNLTAGFGRKWHGRSVALVSQVSRGFGCLRNARSALLVLITSILVWIFEAIFFMMILPCFGLPPGFIRSLITMCLTNLSILVPQMPGYFGVYDLVCSQTLIDVCSISGLSPGSVQPITVDANIALCYAVVVHLVFYVTVTLWGVLALLRYSMELGSTAALAWEAKPIAKLPAGTHQSLSVITSYPALTPKVSDSVAKFWSGLCECFIPNEHIIPDKQAHQRTLHEMSVFTVTELDCLPFRLRVIFGIGIIGFKALTILASGRFLCDIPLERRRELINWWAFGGTPLNRKFMKPIRSLSLFAYYENAEVKRWLDEINSRDSKPSDTESGGEKKLVEAKELEAESTKSVANSLGNNGGPAANEKKPGKKSPRRKAGSSKNSNGSSKKSRNEAASEDGG
jgi:conserved hypothetical protein